MEEPKSCVGGVIEPLTLSLGKHVRDEPVLQVLREGSQDVSGFLGAARRKGQPLEADHRVASPIREPVIARDDRALFVAGGVRQRGVLEPTRGINDELVGSKYELRTETGLERRVRDFDEPFATHAFRGECARPATGH